jgi:hypothetical protein
MVLDVMAILVGLWAIALGCWVIGAGLIGLVIAAWIWGDKHRDDLIRRD